MLAYLELAPVSHADLSLGLSKAGKSQAPGSGVFCLTSTHHPALLLPLPALGAEASLVEVVWNDDWAVSHPVT